MFRAAVLFLLVAATARADDAETVAQLKKLMPKDQLAVAEKAEEIAELGRQWANETNGLKRKELQDKSNKLYKDLTADLTAKVRKDGLVGWVLGCTFVGESGVALSAPGLFGVSLTYDGMAAADKEICRGLEPGDVVVFTLKANPKAQAPMGQAGVVLLQFGRVSGSAVKSLEKK